MDVTQTTRCGALLASMRRERNLTQVELAQRLGKPQSFVSKTEHGERALRLYEVFDYARALEVSSEELVRRVGDSLGYEVPVIS